MSGSPSPTLPENGGSPVPGILAFEWRAFALRTALRCLPAICMTLAAGLVTGHPAAGMIAAGGAVSAGFGAFQQIGGSGTAPVFLAAMGMGICTLVGGIAGSSALALALVAALGGFLCGLLMAAGASASWVCRQSIIALLVISAYPANMAVTTERASLILAGGLLQTLCFLVLRRAVPVRALAALPAAFAPTRFLPVMRVLKESLSLRTEVFHYGLRLAVTLGITAGIARHVSLDHGYWVPMTALLVLKPDFHQTLARVTMRIAGTLVGAALATLIAALMRPQPVVLALLVAVFATLCYCLLHVNYAAY
ncbi:MAG: FUSC family protein, partial [Acidobacteriota bacterium]